MLRNDKPVSALASGKPVGTFLVETKHLLIAHKILDLSATNQFFCKVEVIALHSQQEKLNTIWLLSEYGGIQTVQLKREYILSVSGGELTDE